MATYTITAANTNIDSLTAKTGGDVYNINGGQLVIDQDSRYGLNQTTATSLAAITISATLGGEVLIDGRNVRLIAYTAGTGTVPAGGTLITRGGASGKLICVQSSLTAAPTAVGAAMPATGFIKIKQWNASEYTAGALTGISATASGASVVGTLEIVGDEAATCTVPRLGTFKALGAWYTLGTTSGVANQTLQIPTNGSTLYTPGVFIEKTAASGDYEFYPNAGSQTAVAADVRAKVCWVSTAGLVRIGHNGTANAGFTPAAGLNVVVPNIIFQNCTTAARAANALPNATLATRYDFTTTGGGAIEIDKCALAWYLSFAQAYSVALTNAATLEQISVSEIAAPMTWSKVGVGQTAAQSQAALVKSLCFAGGTFTDCHWSRATLAASGNYTVTITDCAGFSYVDQRSTALTVKGNATTGNYLVTRAANCTWTTPKLTNGRMAFATCDTITVTNASYADVITGTTATTAAQNSYVYEISAAVKNATFSGLDFFGLTNVHPYLGVLSIAAAGCANIKLRNIGGSPASPLSFGSANQSAYLLVLGTGAAAADVKAQRCYVSNTRTGVWTGDNSSTGVLLESVFGDFADAPVTPMLNCQMKSIGATHPLTAQTATYGTHFVDMFTSATAGRIGVLCNEKTSATPSADAYAILSGAPKFTSAGRLYMPLVGDSIEYTMHYYALGHTSFQNAAAVMAGGTIGNYTLQYQLDKNDGAGFGALKTLNGANLSAETGINPALGVKLKLRITTAIANATAITSLYVLTNSTAVAQGNQYPLDTNTLTITNIVPGSDVVILSAGTTNILAQADAISGTSFTYTYSGAQTVDVGLLKNGHVPLYIRALALGTSNATLPTAQVVDRNFA